MQASEWELPGRTWRVTYRYEPDFAKPVDVIKPILDGLFVIASELFEPLTIETQIYYVHATYGDHVIVADEPCWRLEVDLPTATEGKDWEPAHTRTVVDRFDRSVVESFVLKASEQPAPEGEVVCPGALYVTSVRARLPPPWDQQGEVFHIRVAEGFTAKVPIERDERGAWVVGPTPSVLSAPVSIYGFTQGIGSTLQIRAQWSPWYEDDQEGTKSIERAIRALVDQGWTRE